MLSYTDTEQEEMTEREVVESERYFKSTEKTFIKIIAILWRR